MKTARIVLLALLALAAGMLRLAASADAPELLLTLDSPNPQVGARFGGSVAVGDVNGDGKADIAVGAGIEDVDYPDQGRAYVFSGADGSLLFTLGTPNPHERAHFGSPAVGDVNGDGKADIAIAAPDEDVGDNFSQGRVYVFSGADGSLLLTLDTPNPQSQAYFGAPMVVGDVNGDAKADVAVGAWGEDVGDNRFQGRVYVFSGADGSLLFTLDTPHPQWSQQFGWSVAVGDVNHDGKADIAAGAWGETADGHVNQGRAYVFSGADGSLLLTLDTPNPQEGAHFGDSVALGDVNGDGLGDIAVGAPLEEVAGNAYQGRVYVFTGADGSLLFTLDIPNPQWGAGFGQWVGVGDVDSDGRADVAVAATLDDVGDSSDQGRVYVFAGTDGSLLFTLDSPYQVTGYPSGGEPIVLGDVNGDGNADVTVGAPEENVSGNARQGRVYVFSVAPETEICDDGTDNDNDGKTDCDDPDCVGSSACPESVGEPLLLDANAVAVGDADNDGDNEVVFGVGKKVIVKEWDSSSGLWEDNTIYEFSGCCEEVSSLAIADAYNDRQNEVVVGSRSSLPLVDVGHKHLVSLKKIPGPGGWAVDQIDHYTQTQKGIVALAIGDADNDGDNEVIAGESGTLEYLISYEKVNGNWTRTNIDSPYWDLPTVVDNQLTDVCIGDADNDGQNEVTISVTAYLRLIPPGLTLLGYVRQYSFENDEWVQTEIVGQSFLEATALTVGNMNDADTNLLFVGWAEGFGDVGQKVVAYEFSAGEWVPEDVDDDMPIFKVFDMLVGDYDNDGMNELLATTGLYGRAIAYDYVGTEWIETNIAGPLKDRSLVSAAIGDAKNVGRNLVVLGKRLVPLALGATSPVDLHMTDPDGLGIDKEGIEIPSGAYIESDINGDGDPDDLIFLSERKSGHYLISVIPEPDTEPTETYSLRVTAAGETIVLAEDVPISEIPDQPYMIHSTASGISLDATTEPGASDSSTRNYIALAAIAAAALVALSAGAWYARRRWLR